MIKIQPVSKENASLIYDFEVANRSFFEKSLPSRGDQYYELDHFMATIDLICEDQANELLYMNIILDKNGALVGRVNLFPVEILPYKRSFELGYRIGEAFEGKGYATLAAALLIEKAIKEYDIDILQAATSPDNIKSQKVLTKNGFEYVTRIENDIEMNGYFEDSLIFTRILKPIASKESF